MISWLDPGRSRSWGRDRKIILTGQDGPIFRKWSKANSGKDRILAAQLQDALVTCTRSSCCKNIRCRTPHSNGQAVARAALQGISPIEAIGLSAFSLLPLNQSFRHFPMNWKWPTSFCLTLHSCLVCLRDRGLCSWFLAPSLLKGVLVINLWTYFLLCWWIEFMPSIWRASGFLRQSYRGYWAGSQLEWWSGLHNMGQTRSTSTSASVNKFPMWGTPSVTG
jgi:hypothetical protein